MYTLQERVIATSNQNLNPPAAGAASTSDITNAFRTTAKAPTIALPTYDGSNIAEYAAFKAKFQFVITQIAGPLELRATHLE